MDMPFAKTRSFEAHGKFAGFRNNPGCSYEATEVALDAIIAMWHGRPAHYTHLQSCNSMRAGGRATN